MVFTKSQAFIVSQLMMIKKWTPDQWFEKAQLPSQRATPAHVAKKELLQAKGPGIKMPIEQDWHQRLFTNLISASLQEIVGNEVPAICIRQQRAGSPRKEVIVAVKNRHPRGCRNPKRNIPRSRRPKFPA
jgi:hypothetical protein